MDRPPHHPITKRAWKVSKSKPARSSSARAQRNAEISSPAAAMSCMPTGRKSGDDDDDDDPELAPEPEPPARTSQVLARPTGTLTAGRPARLALTVKASAKRASPGPGKCESGGASNGHVGDSSTSTGAVWGVQFEKEEEDEEEDEDEEEEGERPLRRESSS